MSQSFHLPNTSLGSSTAPQTVPLGMTSANAQATTVENPSIGDEAQSLSAGADYSALFSAGESDSWTQDTQNEWLPGFRAMVSK